MCLLIIRNVHDQNHLRKTDLVVNLKATEIRKVT